ncbi:MAG: PHP domain-containing protein [bacterium]|nr:PHP domain-containing protein [bacterium]
MLYNLDLHVHTKASKCFKADNLDNDGINKAIIQQAKDKGLDLIAVTDHYTLKNYLDIKAIGLKEKVKVLPGMELSVKTDSHEKLSLVIIFSEENNIENIGNKLLSELKVPDEEHGNGKFLITKKLPDAVKILNKYNVLIISTHQDKNESRMLSIPVLIKLGIYLFDLHYSDKKEEFMERYSRYNIIPLTFSDCHEVNNVGKCSMSLSLKECSFDGFKDYIESNLRTNDEN